MGRRPIVLAAALLAAGACTGGAVGARTDTVPIVVAVVDTGVDPSQPALLDRLVDGFDAIGGATTSDGGWHGTAVATIIAGAAGSGVESVCPVCRVMPVKALAANGQGNDAAIARGVRWATDHGAQIVNLSLEGPTESPVLRRAIRYAYGKGVVVVAAAGNDGASTPTYPAADPFAVGVAGVDASGRLYPWSNRGRWVTVAAPGADPAGVPGGGTFVFLGTSPAAAVVSGVAGLCLASAPGLTPTLVRRALVAAATPVAGAGFGRVDAARTVEFCRRLAGP